MVKIMILVFLATGGFYACMDILYVMVQKAIIHHNKKVAKRRRDEMVKQCIVISISNGENLIIRKVG